MLQETNSRWSNRYSRLGGLATVIQLYQQGNITFSKVAQLAGCSRGTVHNDIAQYLGSEGYALLLSNRKSIITTTPTLDIANLRVLFTKRLKASSKSDKQKIKPIISILDQAEQANIPLVGVKGSGSYIHFFLQDERTIKIRLAVVNNDHPEHRFGLHRFRVIPSISEYDFAIFAIYYKGTSIIYIFKTSEIARIQSLALRFKWFERKSKYDYARNRWTILSV